MANCTYFYTWCSSLAVNCYLYTNPKRTATVPAGYISDGTSVITVNSSGMITAIGSCSNYPVYGTFLYQSCTGCDLYWVYADGYGGNYSTFIQSNSPTCGCGFYYCDCGYGCNSQADPCYYTGCSEC